MTDVEESIKRNNAILLKERMVPVITAFMKQRGDSPETIKDVLKNLDIENTYAEDVVSYICMWLDNVVDHALEGHELRAKGII